MTGAWLEASPDAPPDAPTQAPGVGAPRRRKARAEESRAADDHVSLALLASLSANGPLLCSLWPDVSAADLLRAPPPAEAFAARCEYALRALDTVARRDADTRARADVAQRTLRQRLDRVRASGDLREDALAELLRAQTDALLDAARVLAGNARVLYATDATRLDAAAEALGMDPLRAREAVRARGYELLATEGREWAPCEALPGAPATMDDAAATLLRHPAQGADAVRSGAVLDWLRANGAAPEVIARARDARLVAERQGSVGDSLAVHMQAWALGRRDLLAGRVILHTPGAIVVAMHAGEVSFDDLARSAREGVLALWLRLQGWVAAAGAADLVARGKPSGMKRLAWSLGVPLVLGDHEFTDPDTLTRTVLATPSLREALVAVYVSGDLLAWLESLSPALRDEQWIDRLRRAQSAPGGVVGHQLPLWWGVYAHARSSSLMLTSGEGDTVTLTSIEPLRVTVQVSRVWDALKKVYASGELIAWLATLAPGDPIRWPSHPPRDLDAELNALLWDLGHPGMVMDWGGREHSVSAPSDLVSAYQSAWQLLEAQVTRGYVLDWLARFHGSEPKAGVELRALVEALRGEIGEVPSGYLALKTALLCGLDYLPLDPRQPGDRATFKGYLAVRRDPGEVAAPETWLPLTPHLQTGSAQVWLALQPGVRPELAHTTMQGAFGVGHQDPESLQRTMADVAEGFGSPRPSHVLRTELLGALSRSQHLPEPADGSARHSGNGWKWLSAALMAMLAVLCFAGWSYERTRDDWGVPGPTPFDGTETLVELNVLVRSNGDGPTHETFEDSGPRTLRAVIQTRDEPLHLGPCDPRSVCEGVFEGVRLSPDVPFEVLVTDDHTFWRGRLGATWLQWHGGARETSHATVGSLRVDLVITQRPPPTTPSPVLVVPPPLPTPPAPQVPVAVPAVPHRHTHHHQHHRSHAHRRHRG